MRHDSGERRWPAAAAAATLALLLTACTSNVTTSMKVLSPTSSAIDAAVSFTGAAASAIESRPRLAAELLHDFVGRTGAEPTRTTNGTTLTYRTSLNYRELVAASGILGVAAASVRIDLRAGSATVRLRLVAPTMLEQAIASAVARDPDHAALAATMDQATTVGVVVSFPGEVTAASLSGGVAGALRTLGNEASYATPLARAVPASLAVRGSLRGPARPSLWLVTGAALLAVAAAVVGLWCRRRLPSGRLGAPRRRRR